MSGPDLAHPSWLAGLFSVWLLAALALALAAWRAAQRRRTLLGDGSPPLRSGDLLLLTALLAVALALAGPRWGERIEKVPATGADVVLLLDVSRSMRARDVPPSRLDRAREAARRLLADLAPGDRAALAAFAGRGVLLTPLTTDKDALAEMLPALDDSLLSEAGSRLAFGLEAALSAFGDAAKAGGAGARPRVVVVLSDGENPHRGASVPVRPLLDAKVRVIAAAFGSEAGATIPDQGGFVVDAEGKVVTSRREGAALSSLASATGGALFLADRWGEVDEVAFAAAVRRDADRTGTGFVLRRIPVSRAAPLAALALALLLAEAGALGVTSVRRWRAVFAAGCALLLLGADSPQGTEARRWTRLDDPRALLALGLAHAEAGAPQDAERAFLAAALSARDAASAGLAYYDLGVMALERGDLEGARDAFFDALAMDPKDGEARFNLEWTLAALAEIPIVVMSPPESPGEPRPRDGANRAPGQAEAGAEAPTEGSDQAAGEAEPAAGEGAAESAAEAAASRSAAEEAGSAGAAQEAGEDAERKIEREPRRLGAEEAARWLESVRDDPGRALASAARATAPRPRALRPGSPTW